MTPAVVVELAPVEAASPMAAVLVQACSDAVRGARGCVRADGAESDAGVVAIVSWDGADRRVVRIEVGRKSAVAAAWRTREVAFERGDAEVERWRAAGIVIAVLVGELEAEPALAKDTAAVSAPGAAPGSASTPTPTRAADARPAPSPRDAGRSGPADDGRRGWTLGAPMRSVTLLLSTRLAQGTEGRTWLGLGGRAEVPLGGAGVRVGASVEWLEGRVAPVIIDATSLGAAISLTRRLGELPIEVTARADGRARLLQVHADDFVAGSDDAGRWVGGVGGGLDVAWEPSGRWALVGEGSYTRWFGTTAVDVQGARIAFIGASQWAAGLGVRAAW